MCLCVLSCVVVRNNGHRKKKKILYNSFCFFAFLHDDDLESRHNIGYHCDVLVNGFSLMFDEMMFFFGSLFFEKYFSSEIQKHFSDKFILNHDPCLYRLTGLWITNSRLLGCFVNIYPIQQDGGTANSAIGDGLSLNWFLQHLSLIICALFSACVCI